MISRRNTIVCAALTGLCAGVVLSPAPMPVRVMFGVPFVLVLPGYALTSALFTRGRLGNADVLLFSVALSLSIVVIGALGLNLLPFGLTARTWTGLLLGTTGVAALWAVLRLPPDADHESTHLRRLSSTQLWLLTTALLITVGAIAFARIPLPAKGVRGYTVLWILPRAGERRGIEVGVESSELRRTSYQLQVRVGDNRTFERRLTLAPGGRWLIRFQVNPSIRRVDARLFRSDSPKHVYRRVRLLIRPSSAPS